MQLAKTVLTCSCHSKEHEIEFCYDDSFFYALIHLAPHSFLKRLKQGIKYIFGYRCAYGDFEEMIFEETEIKKLLNIIYDFSYDHKAFIEGTKTKIKGQQEVDGI